MEVGEDFSFVPQKIPRLLFVYTIDGKGTLLYNDESKGIKEGDAFFVDLRKSVQIRAASPVWRFILIQMSGNLAFDLLKYIELNRGYAMSVRGDVPVICEHIFDLAKQKNWSLDADLEIAALLYQLMGIVMLVPADSRLDQSLSYIHQHYAENISVDFLSRIACMSQYHYIRCFRELTGTTPLEYINIYRIRVAQELLNNSDKPISIIASLVGFNDPSYFTRQFKKLTGSLPSEHRAFYQTHPEP